jgi:uncharacterized heparinase superfamily protein
MLADGRVSGLALYFNTIRHLRLVQIAGRLYNRVHRPRPRLRPTPLRRQFTGPFAQPVAPLPSMLGPEDFRFLNAEGKCVGADGWQAAAVPKLWLYNLHYFDDLNSKGAATRSAWHEALLRRWIAENPPGEGVGWESYPLSRRLVNWVKWAAAGHSLPPESEASLAVQARWLMGSLEYHLLGNHLLANAKALVFAGLYFQGTEAEGWFRKGCRIMQREMREQVLEDGGHFELSPMYHATVLEDLLDVANLCAAHGMDVSISLLDAIARMRRWLQVMQHPDGRISFFNDAAFSIAPLPADLEAYAERLGLPGLQAESGPLVTLRNSGYVRAEAGPACLICDCAPIGPDYLPGHAHADTLSFEMSLYGQRVFVNSGTSRYGIDAERQRQRGTAAHNAVTIDGQDSSEVWAGFRVARRARAALELATAGESIVIQARHDGYRRLPGRNVHRRRWVLEQGSLRIEDSIRGPFTDATAYFHLHPEIRITELEDSAATLSLPAGQSMRLSFESVAELQAAVGTWHPEFGLSIPNLVLRARFQGPVLVTRAHWSDPK